MRVTDASPHGKDPGEKVPGQRKKLGARAAREYAGGQQRSRERTGPPHRSRSRQQSRRRAGWLTGLPTFAVMWFLRRRSRE